MIDERQMTIADVGAMPDMAEVESVERIRAARTGPRGKFQVCEPLSDEEYEGLKADIIENGIRDPIEIDEEAEILDGHNRKEIADEAGIPCPFKVIYGLPDDEAKRDFARKRNCLRRQIDVEAKKRMARDILSENSSRSSRSVGKTVGLHHLTVEGIRKDMGLPGQSIHNQDDEVVIENQAPVHQWMNAKAWQSWHKMEAFAHLVGIGDEQKRVLDEILDERPRQPREALEMLSRCVQFMERDRRRMVDLWDSEDPRRRSLVLSKLAGVPPVPDPRLVLLVTARQPLEQAGALCEGDENAGRLLALLQQWIQSIQAQEEQW